MIRYFSSSADSAVGLDVFKTVVGSFKCLTIAMMSSGLCNSLRLYWFRFSLNLFYWSLASLFSDVVPKNAPKSFTSPLKFLVDDVYAELLKRPPLTPRLWWPPLLVRPPWKRPRPPLLEFYLLVSKARVIFASLPYPPLLSAAVEAVSVSGVILFYSFSLFLSEYCWIYTLILVKFGT